MTPLFGVDSILGQLLIRGGCLFFAYALFVLWKISKLLPVACSMIGDGIVGILCLPFTGLYTKLKETLSDRLEPKLRRWPLHRLSNAVPVLGSPRVIASVLLSLLLITLCYLRVREEGSLDIYGWELFCLTPLGALYNLLVNGVSLTPAVLISSSCSSLIAWLLLTGGEEGGYAYVTFSEMIVAFLYHIIFLVVGCIIGMQLKNFWPLLADWFSSLHVSLKESYTTAKDSGAGIMKLIFTGLPLALLIYVWLIAMVVAIREFVVSIGHGIMAVMLMGALFLAFIVFLPSAWLDGSVGDYIGIALIATVFLVSEYTRATQAFIDPDNCI